MPNELDGADSASPAFGFHAIISMGWPAAHIEAVENITAKSTPKNDVLVTAYSQMTSIYTNTIFLFVIDGHK